jgi:superfamily II DNA or RNA helicase
MRAMAAPNKKTKTPTRKKLKGFLGNAVYRQAVQLIDTGMYPVFKAVEHRDGSELFTALEGLVQERSGEKHRVQIILRSDGYITDAVCSCGSEQPCFHIGSVLISYSGENGSSVNSGSAVKPGNRSPVDGTDASHFAEYRIVSDPEIRIDFEPSILEGDSVRFRPVYRFSEPSPDSQSYRDILIREDKGKNRYLLYSESRRIVWECNLPDSAAAMLHVHSGLKLHEIDNLRTLIDTSPLVGIDFTASGYSLSTEEAVPLLDITEYREGISIKLNYKVQEELFTFDINRRFYGHQNAEGQLKLTYVLPKQSIRYFKRVRENLGDSVIREEPSGSRYHLTAKLSAADFILSYGAELIDAGFEIRKQGTLLRKISSGSFGLKISVRNNWLEVEAGELTSRGLKSFAFDPSGLESGMVRSGKEFFLIDKRTIENLKKLLLLGMDKRGKMGISVYNPVFWKEFSGYISNKNSTDFSGIRAALSSLENFTGLTECNEPAGFKGRLRKYQKAGLSWLLFLRDYRLAGALCDDMGLGKTIQTLALLQQCRNDGLLTRALVVAPVSTLPNWQREIEHFTPDLSVYRYHGQQRDVEKLKEHDLVLTSYATLRNDIDIFTQQDITYLILDEAHAIKNATSRTFKAVRMLSAPHRLALTGTPLENSLTELWAQFDFLLPGLLGSRNSFYERFVKEIELKHFRDEGSAADKKTALLRSMIHPFILRRTKQSAAPDLPEKEEILLYAEMEEDQDKFYHGLREYYRDKIHSQVELEGIGKSTVTIFEALLRLRQASIFPALVSEEYRNVSSCKFELLKEALGDILSEGHKAIVFSQFIGSLKRIEEHAARRNYGYVYLDGSTKDREERISAFQNDPAVRLFLLSLKAGGVGINLTAADYVILFDPWWNPAVERQAIDRVHRIGRDSRVIAYRYIVKDTVEEKILTLQQRKRDLADEIVTEESSFAKSLNREDLEFLFS